MIQKISTIFSLLFPNICPGCNKALLKNETSICLHCQSDLPRRLTFNNEELKHRFYGRLQLEEVYSFLLFKNKGLTQKLLHAIKYNGNQQLAVELGELFGISCKQQNLFTTVDIIVPIPLHKSKLRFRGFNQSAQIAKGLASTLGIGFDENSILRKTKTSTQTKKTRTERWKNVDKTFKVVNSKLEGKHVLLVDDVITTGATLESCGQTILASGASKISIACLALA